MGHGFHSCHSYVKIPEGMSWWVVLILQILNDQIWVGASCNGGSKNNPIFCRLCIWKPMVLRYHAVPHFSETPKWSKNKNRNRYRIIMNNQGRYSRMANWWRVSIKSDRPKKFQPWLRQVGKLPAGTRQVAASQLDWIPGQSRQLPMGHVVVVRFQFLLGSNSYFEWLIWMNLNGVICWNLKMLVKSSKTHQIADIPIFDP